MNSLQIELNEINEKLELLTYRKNQLDSIITEYSDVINRVKNLIDSMQDANVEPSNLLMEIEGIVHGVTEPEPTPDTPETATTPEMTPEPIETPSTALSDSTDSQPMTAETPEMTAKPFTFDISLYPRTNSLGLPVYTPESTPETDDDNDCDTDGLDDEDYPFDYDCDDEIEELETEPEQRGNSLLFQPNIYWDNGSSVRAFIPKKRRYKGELEAIVKDCIEQGLAERYDLDECGTDWIIQLAPVTTEDTVKRIIGEFYPVHTDGDTTPQPTPEPTPKSSNPELLKLMALVPTVAVPTPTPEPTPEPTPKTQLNERAWRRNDTLLIGFSNKKLMNNWSKWVKDSWGDRVKIDSLEKLEGFEHCLSILWFGKADWERLSSLNYSLKPTEQNKQKQQPETPAKATLEDIKAVLKQLHDDGLPAILKGELLAHHFNSLTASELEEHLEKLAEQGLINLGDHSIILKFPEPTISTDNPAFEYEQVDEKQTKIYADGVLIGLAKDCGTHWESPQFKGQTFPNRRDVVNALWQLVNQF